jgi:hypothetical protein
VVGAVLAVLLGAPDGDIRDHPDNHPGSAHQACLTYVTVEDRHRRRPGRTVCGTEPIPTTRQVEDGAARERIIGAPDRRLAADRSGQEVRRLRPGPKGMRSCNGSGMVRLR